MNKMNWTPKQQEAIDTRNKNILVSAAAGSGKTAVLTQRIIDLITKEDVDIASMLVLTFTNAAANEMSARIQKKMYEYLEENRNNKHIKKQISMISAASISTMKKGTKIRMRIFYSLQIFIQVDMTIVNL